MKLFKRGGGYIYSRSYFIPESRVSRTTHLLISEKTIDLSTQSLSGTLERYQDLLANLGNFFGLFSTHSFTNYIWNTLSRQFNLSVDLLTIDFTEQTKKESFKVFEICCPESRRSKATLSQKSQSTVARSRNYKKKVITGYSTKTRARIKIML